METRKTATAPEGATWARIGAGFYVAWGLFHLRVAYDIYELGAGQSGLAQGRIFQLAAYMLTISLFVIAVAVLKNSRNDRTGYWLNLIVAGWADLIWVAVVVAPGYVGLLRGLAPPAIFLAGAAATTLARRAKILSDQPVI
ncbi:hypothetical protein [Methylocella silvestris]|uniref:Uncharacterized protein n=1 Tax=Methylocella silvestris TaxID=199596 RepID=A0A2J7TJ75_METSI|nr:hypothetical protein [Methylocella silvestris]PNG26822.1 hypothetical protein CR492_05705 [Methylocella silvestris]